MTWRQHPGRTPKVGLKVRIPRELHDKVTLIMLDPVYMKVKYGGWTDLMTAILQQWLDEQIKEHRQELNDVRRANLRD